jgi:Protein of unknown function (DUF2563)
MFVDTAQLHSGASESRRASEHAQAGANHLSDAPPVAGMFGSFAAADDFHDAVSAAHAYHNHQENLNDVGTKAHRAGYAFTATEDQNMKVLREV